MSLLDGFNDYSFLNRPEDCFAWLEKRFPSLCFRVVSLFGSSSTRKTSFASEVIGAQTVRVSDDQNTPCLQFFAAVTDDKMKQLAKGADPSSVSIEYKTNLLEATPEQLESQALISSERKFLVKPDSYRFPPDSLLPRFFNKNHDAKRYGTLYINSDSHSGLEAYFRRLIPEALHGDLPKAVLTLVNVDLVTDDPRRKAQLLRTVVIDTRGLETNARMPTVASSSKSKDEPFSEVGKRVFQNSSRSLFFFHNVTSQNKRPCAEFEEMVLKATYGDDWFSLPWMRTIMASSGPMLGNIASGFAGPIAGKVTSVVTDAVVSNFVGTAADKDKQQQNKTSSSKHDSGTDLWKKVYFVRGALDESQSYQYACQAGGTCLAYFANFPTGAQVRQIANPHFAKFRSEQERQRVELHNEFEFLVEDILSPKAHDQDKLCDVIREAKQMLREQTKENKFWNSTQWWENSVKKMTMRGTPLSFLYDPNTTEYYLNRMGEHQKCPE